MLNQMSNRENNFDPKSVAFALITYFPKWYKGKLRSIKHTDKVRGDLALEFITKAIVSGYQVVAVDGNSSKTFQKQIRAIPQLHFRRRLTSKRSPKRRLAFEIASRLPFVKVIVVAEAEKVSLLTDGMPHIVKPILAGEADIVIPKREDQLFKSTYPQYMYESEKEGNMFYNQNLRLHGFIKGNEELDMFFGPRVFKNNPQILKLFMKKYKLHINNSGVPSEYFDTEEYSNTIFFPIIEALKKKFKVKSVEIPFSYPLLQKQNEEKGELEFFIQKRKLQRLSIILELMYFLHYLQYPKKGS